MTPGSGQQTPTETPFTTGTIDDGPDLGIRVAMATSGDQCWSNSHTLSRGSYHDVGKADVYQENPSVSLIRLARECYKHFVSDEIVQLAYLIDVHKDSILWLAENYERGNLWLEVLIRSSTHNIEAIIGLLIANFCEICACTEILLCLSIRFNSWRHQRRLVEGCLSISSVSRGCFASGTI